MTKTIYVAGPMRGVPKYNFPHFDMAAQHLRYRGWYVVNPADRDRDKYEDIESWPEFATGELTDRFDIHDALRWDIGTLVTCDAICLLPEWEHSEGAQLEHRVATACGLDTYLW